MYKKAEIFLIPFATLPPTTSENFPQFTDKLTNLQSPWFSDDNCPVEIKPASFQEFVLLIHTGMSEKGIWLTYFHPTVVIEYKSSLQLFDVSLTSFCDAHLKPIGYRGL